MARNSRSSTALALGVLVAIAGGASASAHRRDEYLQAARVAIDPARVRVELDLTPGITVADAVLSEIDRDRDGSISAAEADAYVRRVSADVALDVDGAALRPALMDRGFPAVEAMRRGEGTIRIDLAADLPRLDAGPHHVRYRNSHRADIGVYLANALVPDSDRVSVTGQERDVNQRTLDIAFIIAPAPGHRRLWVFLETAALVAGGVLVGVVYASVVP